MCFNVAPSLPHIVQLFTSAIPLFLGNLEIGFPCRPTARWQVESVPRPPEWSVRHLLSKRPPQVIAKVRKEELERWLDNIFREAPSQLVTSWIRRELPCRSVSRSVRPIPTARLQPDLSGGSSFIQRPSGLSQVF